MRRAITLIVAGLITAASAIGLAAVHLDLDIGGNELSEIRSHPPQWRIGELEKYFKTELTIVTDCKEPITLIGKLEFDDVTNPFQKNASTLFRIDRAQGALHSCKNIFVGSNRSFSSSGKVGEDWYEYTSKVLKTGETSTIEGTTILPNPLFLHIPTSGIKTGNSTFNYAFDFKTGKK